MSHLSPERLAALADETPTPIEAAHVTTCDACSAEIAAQRRLARLAAAAQVVPGAPVSSFDALVPRLVAEGLVAPRDGWLAARRWAVRIAASLVLLVGGAVAGRMTATRALPLLPAVQARGWDQGAAVGQAALSGATFGTTDDAMSALAAAQQTYQNAAAFLAAQDTSAHFIGLNPGTYRTRLAALDQVMAATRAALYQAPQDPVLNHYYLGTLTAREATLSQLRQALPASRRLGAY